MTKTKQHLYEGMYILSSTLSEEARKKALDKIISAITDEGGEIRKIFDQGRRKLAYEIDGRREGYYFVLYFSAGPEGIKEKWRDYHLNEDLIRFLTLRAAEVPESLEFKQLVRE